MEIIHILISKHTLKRRKAIMDGIVIEMGKLWQREILTKEDEWDFYIYILCSLNRDLISTKKVYTFITHNSHK